MKKIILGCVFMASTLLTAQIEFMYSDFEEGTLEEWTNTDASTTMLSVNEAPGFMYLHKECDGSTTPVGEMAIVNTGLDWIGNHWYDTGSVGIALANIHNIWMQNPNDFDLHIRIGITGSNGFQVVTTDPLIVPELSDWSMYYAPGYSVDYLSLYNLTVINDTGGMSDMEINENVEEMFEDVIEFKIFHNEIISYEGAFVNGDLDIDTLETIFLLSTNERETKVFSLSPNPVNDQLNMISDGTRVNQVTIYSLTGAKVLQPSVNTSLTINLSQLSSGLYFVEIESDRGREIHRIVKE